MPQLDEILALSLIEQGSQQMPLDRAVLMTAVFGGMTRDDAALLPLDRRDRLLIEQRIVRFGSRIEFFARCPDCDEGNEAEFDLAALLEPTPQSAIACDIAGEHLVLRAPTSRDVGAAAVAGAPQALLRACVEGCDGPIGAELAPAIEAAIGEAFPLLYPRFDLACSACDASFSIRFDIAAWLWREIEQLAARAVDAVDRLARAYSWSESEILALSPLRRRFYLARIAG